CLHSCGAPRPLHSFPPRRSSDLAPAEQAAAPQTTTQSEPAASAPDTLNSEAAQAEVKHYADMAHAIFSDAHGTALKLQEAIDALDRKSTRLNSSHVKISYAVFCL